jgi:hypothetical protein
VVIKEYGLSPEDCAALPSFRTLPLTFSIRMRKPKMEGRHTFYHYCSAERMRYRKSDWNSLVVDEDTKDWWFRQNDHECAMVEQDPNRDEITIVHDPFSEMI